MLEQRNETVKKFQKALENANGNRVKMKKAFKSIVHYLDSGFSKKASGQNLDDYLSSNPDLKEIYDWSGTVMVSNNYRLFNY